MALLLRQKTHVCPRCKVKYTDEELSHIRYTCTNCGLELAYLNVSESGKVLGIYGWLLFENDIIQNRYQIISILGRGGFGTTYLVKDLNLEGRLRALKEVPELLFDEYEAKLLSRVNHPYIPDIIDRTKSNKMVYLIMEYRGACTLADEVKSCNGRIPIQKLIPWIYQLCTVLDYLHSQTPPIIHRDLKPDNILLDDNNCIMLIDFGIAKQELPMSVTRTMGRAANLGFSPPEQLLRVGTTQLSDVYSLGATIYYCLSGQMLPNAYERIAGKAITPLRELVPDVPALLDSIVTKSLELAQDRRPSSIKEIKYIFKDLYKSQGTDPTVPIKISVNKHAIINRLDVASDVTLQKKTEPPHIEDSKTHRIATLERSPRRRKPILHRIKEYRSKELLSKNWPYLLLVGVIILVGSGSYMMVPHILDYIKRQHVDKHFAELTTLLNARQWTPERLATGASLLQQIAESAPQDMRIENARDTLASGYAELARGALAEGKWHTAVNLVAAGMALTPGNRMGVELGNISAAIRNTQSQQQEIFYLERRLEDSLASMKPTGAAAKEVLEMVRKLSSLNPQHPGLEEKRNQVADKLAAAATELGQSGNWLAGIALVNESLILLPDSIVLAKTKAELERSYAGKLSQDRLLKEEAQKRAEVQRQVRSPKQVRVQPPVPPKPVPETPQKPTGQQPQWKFTTAEEEARRRAEAQKQAEAAEQIKVQPPVPPEPVPETPPEQRPDGGMTAGDEGAKKGVEVLKQAETAKPAKPLELPEIELIGRPLSPPTMQESPALPKPPPDAAERSAGQQPPWVITSGEGGNPKQADAPKETQPAKQTMDRKPPASPKPVPKVPEKPAGQQPPWTIVPGGT